MLAWRLALRQVLRFPLRTLLMLACGGLSAALVVAALNTTGAGRAQLLAQLDAMGGDLLTISPALSRNVGARARTGTIVTTLRAADLQALLRDEPAVAASSQVSTAAFLAKAGDFSKNGAAIVGVEAAYFAMRRWPAAAGGWFSVSDDRRGARVALLGATVARDLFAGADPVGRRILLNRVPFDVVGVLAARGQRLDAANEDDQIYIPFTTLQHRLLNRDYDSEVFLEIAPTGAMAEAAAAAAALLRRRHHLAPGAPDDFQIQNQQTLIQAQAAASGRLEQLVRTAGAGGLLAAALALLALHTLALGARQRELGVRRALGATIAALYAQLAAEALLLAAATAGLAAGAGWVFTAVAERRAGLAPWAAPRADALVVALAAALDLAFALLPARRAARRDPVRVLAGN